MGYTYARKKSNNAGSVKSIYLSKETGSSKSRSIIASYKVDKDGNSSAQGGAYGVSNLYIHYRAEPDNNNENLIKITPTLVIEGSAQSELFSFEAGFKTDFVAGYPLPVPTSGTTKEILELDNKPKDADDLRVFTSYQQTFKDVSHVKTAHEEAKSIQSKTLSTKDSIFLGYPSGDLFILDIADSGKLSLEPVTDVNNDPVKLGSQISMLGYNNMNNFNLYYQQGTDTQNQIRHFLLAGTNSNELAAVLFNNRNISTIYRKIFKLNELDIQPTDYKGTSLTPKVSVNLNQNDKTLVFTKGGTPFLVSYDESNKFKVNKISFPRTGNHKGHMNLENPISAKISDDGKYIVLITQPLGYGKSKADINLLKLSNNQDKIIESSLLVYNTSRIPSNISFTENLNGKTDGFTYVYSGENLTTQGGIIDYGARFKYSFNDHKYHKLKDNFICESNKYMKDTEAKQHATLVQYGCYPTTPFNS
jgi:hypothetical protein